jgi:hypothetical protein
MTVIVGTEWCARRGVRAHFGVQSRTLSGLAIPFVALLLTGFAAGRARAEECPRAPTSTAPSAASSDVKLEGRVVYHNGIRQWFELKLRRPVCGQASVQLVPLNDRYRPLEVLRNCRVVSVGSLDYSGTGYYSLDLYQDSKTIRPMGACAVKSPLPRPSSLEPDRQVRQYRVDMRVNYRRGDHPIRFRVLAGGRKLRPWQAYASYDLTGGFVLYGHCGEGFVVDKVFGPPEARPGHFDEPREPSDMAMWDPEAAAGAGKWDLGLGYTCVRAPSPKRN